MADAITRKKRPVYLTLVRPSLELPLPGIVSILHRISGAMPFFFLFLLLSLLQDSLALPYSIAAFTQTVSDPVVKLIFLSLLWPYLHHYLCAGIRDLFLDATRAFRFPPRFNMITL